MKKEYKWTLRKGSKKEICPNCGKARFVPYVLAKDGKTLAGAEFGRCDREQNCGYQKYPNGIDKEAKFEPVKQVPVVPIVFDNSVASVALNGTLFDYFVSKLDFQDVCNTWNDYRVGQHGDATAFWQIDKDMHIRGGKFIEYNTDGHRRKDVRLPVRWAHRLREYTNFYTGRDLQQCYFGEHLLRKYPNKPVAVVESEKTALWMSIVEPKYLWLACGGSCNLNDERKAAVLLERDVVLIPDQGQFARWSTIACKFGFRVSSFVEENSVFEGCDIMDIVIANK